MGPEELAVVVEQVLHEAEEVVEADVAGAAAVVLAEPVFEDARCYCKLHRDMNQVLYRVTMVVMHLGWVDLDLLSSTLLLGSR